MRSTQVKGKNKYNLYWRHQRVSILWDDKKVPPRGATKSPPSGGTQSPSQEGNLCPPSGGQKKYVSSLIPYIVAVPVDQLNWPGSTERNFVQAPRLCQELPKHAKV